MQSPTPCRSPLPAATLIALSLASASSFAAGPTPLPLAAVQVSTAFALASLADPEAAEMSGLAFADPEVVKALTLLEAGKPSDAISGLTMLIDSKELAKSPRADELRLAVCMIRVRTGESSKVKDDLKRLTSALPAKGADAVPTAAIARVLQQVATSKSLGKAGDLKTRGAWHKLLAETRTESAAEFEKHTKELAKVLKGENLGAIKSSAAKSHAAFDDLMAIKVESAETEKAVVEQATELASPIEAFGKKVMEQGDKIEKLQAEMREIRKNRRDARGPGENQKFIAPQKAKGQEIDTAKAEYDARLDAARPAFDLYDQVQQRYTKAIPKLSVSLPGK